MSGSDTKSRPQHNKYEQLESTDDLPSESLPETNVQVPLASVPVVSDTAPVNNMPVYVNPQAAYPSVPSQMVPHFQHWFSSWISLSNIGQLILHVFFSPLHHHLNPLLITPNLFQVHQSAPLPTDFNSSHCFFKILFVIYFVLCACCFQWLYQSILRSLTTRCLKPPLVLTSFSPQCDLYTSCHENNGT